MTRPIEMISGLPAANPISDDDLLVITQDGDSKQVPVTDLQSVTGQTLGLAAPTASTAGIAVNVANTFFRVPELTTAAFTMPDRPVFVAMPNLLTLGAGLLVGEPRTSYQIRYTKDAWATSHVIVNQPATWFGSGFETGPAQVGMVPPAAGTALVAGDSVQVAFGFVRTDTTETMSVVVAASSGASPFVHVWAA